MSAKPRLVNVEPLMFFAAAGNTLYNTLYQAVFSYKQCLERRPGEHAFCQALGSNAEDTTETRTLLNEVQASTAQYLILYQMASTLPSVVLAMFIGAWCDKYGRKPPLIVATAGSALAVGLAVMCAAIDALPSTTLILAALIKGCTGQAVVTHLAAFAMIADSVTVGKRVNATLSTIRVGIASGVISVGALLGSLLAGVLLDFFGSFAYAYAVGCGFITLATVYAVFVLEETLHWPHYLAQNVCSGKEREFCESVEEVPKLTSSQNCIIFLLSTMKQTFQVLIRRRDGRARLYLILAYVSFLALASFEPSGVIMLYAKHPPLSFTDSQYSYLTAMTTASSVVSEMVFAVLLKRFVKLSDLTLVLMGILVYAAKNASFAFITEAWLIVVVSVLGGIGAIEIVGIRSYFGSLVDNSEKGRLYAAVFIIDDLGPLLSACIVNNLYAVTLPVFPGAVFLLRGVVGVIVFIIFGWMHFDSHIGHGEKAEPCFTRVNSEKSRPGSQYLPEYDEKTPLLSKAGSEDVIVL